MSDRGPREDPALYAALGRAIKVERTARGMSRRELAERAGISYPYLSEIENGTKRAGPRPLLLIARVFGVSQSDLLRVAEEHTGEASSPVTAMAAEADLWSSSWRIRSEPLGDRGGRSHRREILGELVQMLAQMSVEDLERARTWLRTALKDGAPPRRGRNG